ncbi:uncharacterized protein LOC111022557 [Momordica charantia]|uniref:Uncharacterized protein LOC111022557 n=1 Tax=Momordica charantia TaxID=3673 RepID=A0A6J1DQ71_MOMCH|nr:uncharacterized protein LOC111022557 [Momordica charantia]
MLDSEVEDRLREERLENRYKEISGKDIEISGGEDDKSIIPKHFALQNYRPRFPQPKTAPYLRYVQDHEKQVDGFLQFSGKKLPSPVSKFHSEASESDPRFMHIRCSYNNKYWVRQSPDSNYIVAIGTKQENDQSKWSCTLFEPIYDADHKGYRFRHVQLGYELFRASLFDEFPDGLLAKEKGATIEEWEDNAFNTLIDWDSLVILPKHVTFKGSNGKYLKYNGHYLQFSGTDVENPSHIHEIFPKNDGTIRIKNVGCQKFWIRDPNWIVVVAEDSSRDDLNSLFQPVKLGNNIVALRSLGNNHFCTSLSIDGKSNCLNADLENPIVETEMEFAEAVMSSRIENIEYRMKDAKIYGERVWSMVKGDAINKTRAADTVQFTFSFEDKMKRNWTNALGVKFGVSKQFTAGVPMIGDGSITVSVVAGGEYAWGETQKEKRFMSCSSTITVPPMSKVKMNAIVKRGFCNVPFSYTKIDTLRDGTQISREYDDGVFNGIQSYDFQFRSDKVVLPL